MANFIENQRKAGKKIGFVPTMGALHEGHISLVRQCLEENGLVVSSIFVNPAQFNNPADFEKYPITIEKDIDQLESAGCDVLFLPELKEVYPPEYKKKHYPLGYLEEVLEGKYRPGHFQGVCQVVDRLLELVHCDQLYLGQKDYQQCMVISKLVEIKKSDTAIKIAATIREKDGLAMSSRNTRLDEKQRKQAVTIYETLQWIKNNLRSGDLASLKKEAVHKLEEKGFVVDYAECCSPKLDILDVWDGKSGVVALIAAYLGDTRLIDNMAVS